MSDLFRFLLLRPADVYDRSKSKSWGANFTKTGMTFEEAKAAQNFVDGGSLLGSIEILQFATLALSVVSAVGTDSMPAKDVSTIVERRPVRAPKTFRLYPSSLRMNRCLPIRLWQRGCFPILLRWRRL